MNMRSRGVMKPNNAFYQKSMTENAPTWQEKRDYLDFLINESQISPLSKTYLRESQEWVPRYQLRGFKYGLIGSSIVYFFFPVVRRSPFVYRFTISAIPMFYFMRWGHVWGHENMWRRAKEVIVTYEIATGARSKFTMK